MFANVRNCNSFDERIKCRLFKLLSQADKHKRNQLIAFNGSVRRVSGIRLCACERLKSIKRREKEENEKKILKYLRKHSKLVSHPRAHAINRNVVAIFSRLNLSFGKCWMTPFFLFANWIYHFMFAFCFSPFVVWRKSIWTERFYLLALIKFEFPFDFWLMSRKRRWMQIQFRPKQNRQRNFISTKQNANVCKIIDQHFYFFFHFDLIASFARHDHKLESIGDGEWKKVRREMRMRMQSAENNEKKKNLVYLFVSSTFSINWICVTNCWCWSTAICFVWPNATIGIDRTQLIFEFE